MASETSGPARARGRNRDTPRHAQWTLRNASIAVLAALAGSASAEDSASCISLKGSKLCPAFQAASISTNQSLIDTFSFLKYVSNLETFDIQLDSFVKTTYLQDKFQLTFGCHNVNYSDPSDMYARYTTTVLCSSIVQASAAGCGVSEKNSEPLCAETCAEYAQSEAYITADTALCGNPSSDLNKLIRADFAVCSNPEQALSSNCVVGSDNEPDNCGFGNSTVGLCSYCGAGGINSTDTCCYNSDAEKRCKGVKLPDITVTFTAPVPTSTATSSSAPVSGGGSHLSGGAIAGIVIGSLAGVIILAALLFFCIRLMRRRRGSSSQTGSIFNQPQPARKGPPMSQGSAAPPRGYEILPGGRIARMSALEGHSGDSPSRHGSSPSARAVPYAAKTSDRMSSSEFGDTPEPETPYTALRGPPATSRRQGSLSSNSMLGSDVAGSPLGFSSPHALASQQSEQLPFFKDYYSQDDIHPHDKVAVLWAYQPRAPDEFGLERGDMLKVVGIWDDGWATGLMVNERAEEWEARRQAQRDSGVSSTSAAPRDSSPQGHGELKAFPLVCVCLPEHWRKTIEGDGSTDTGASGHLSASHM